MGGRYGRLAMRHRLCRHLRHPPDLYALRRLGGVVSYEYCRYHRRRRSRCCGCRGGRLDHPSQAQGKGLLLRMRKLSVSLSQEIERTAQKCLILSVSARFSSVTLTVVFKVNIYLTFTTPCGRILVFYAEIVFWKNHGCLP